MEKLVEGKRKGKTTMTVTTSRKPARWMAMPNFQVSYLVRNLEDQPTELYHLTNYILTREQVQAEGICVTQHHWETLTNGDKSYLLHHLIPIQPEEEPVEPYPLEDGAPDPGPQKEAHYWQGYEFQKKTGKLSPGYLRYCPLSKLPYGISRSTHKSNARQWKENDLNHMLKDALENRKVIHDWAHSIGIAQDILQWAMKIAILKGQEAKERATWLKVENVKQEALELLESAELVDLQSRAMLKLIPSKYWNKDLKAEDGWVAQPYPMYRFMTMLLPSKHNDQMPTLAEWKSTKQIRTMVAAPSLNKWNPEVIRREVDDQHPETRVISPDFRNMPVATMSPRTIQMIPDHSWELNAGELLEFYPEYEGEQPPDEIPPDEPLENVPGIDNDYETVSESELEIPEPLEDMITTEAEDSDMNLVQTESEDEPGNMTSDELPTRDSATRANLLETEIEYRQQQSEESERQRKKTEEEEMQKRRRTYIIGEMMKAFQLANVHPFQLANMARPNPGEQCLKVDNPEKKMT